MLRKLNRLLKYYPYKLLKYYPSLLMRNVGMALTRRASHEFRAYTDIFISKYADLRDWRSGLGDSHYLLYSIVRTARPNVIVEIGSARGKSTCTIALACRENGFGKVYAIDPHKLNDWTDVGVGESSYDFLMARLLEYKLDTWCQVMPMTSQRASDEWSKPIDLLFIDGDHTYDGVKFDFEAFRPWLTKNALVLFHDTTWEYLRSNQYYRSDMGVPKFMRELQEEGYHSVTIDAPPGLTILSPHPGGFAFFPEDEDRSPHLAIGG